MNDLKITVNAPELAQAMNNLADAIRSGKANAQPAAAAPTAAANAPQAPMPQAQPQPTVQAPTAPVQPIQQPAPAPMPQAAPAPQPVPVPQAAPAPAPVQAPQAAPMPQPTPAPAPAPQATQVPATGVTLDAIINAGAGLVEKGMMAQVVALLGKYGLQAVNQLQPAQYEPFAAELRTLGAAI